MKTALLSFIVAILTVISSILPLSELRAQAVGVSVERFDSAFQTIVRNGILAEAAKSPGVKVQMEDAQSDTSRQLDQVRNFISAGVDAIIVFAVDADSTPILTKTAHEAGVPLVYVLHPPGDLAKLPEKTAFVGSDEKDSGTMQAREVCRLLNGKGRAYVLMGPLSNESSIIRTQDVRDVLATDACKGISIIAAQSANWNRTEAADLMSNWLSAGEPFDAVIANNDEMAIGAIQSLKAAGKDLSRIVVSGIDATPDGLKAMATGELDVTVFQNETGQGESALATALSLVRGEKPKKTIWIPFELVTPENMAQYAVPK